MTIIPLKGLNLSPVQAAEIVHGLSRKIVMSGNTRYRGPVVLRSNKTVPPDGQHLPDVGYRVEHEGDKVFLKRMRGAPRASRRAKAKVPVVSGLIVGSATIEDVQKQPDGYLWTFTYGEATEQRCPAMCTGPQGSDGLYGFRVRGKDVVCPVCKGQGSCEPVDIGTVIRRAWFQWDPLKRSGHKRR
jgi:hypothetical protein